MMCKICGKVSKGVDKRIDYICDTCDEEENLKREAEMFEKEGWPDQDVDRFEEARPLRKRY